MSRRRVGRPSPAAMSRRVRLRLFFEHLHVVGQILRRGLVDRYRHSLKAVLVDERYVCLMLAVAELRLDREAAVERLQLTTGAKHPAQAAVHLGPAVESLGARGCVAERV